MKSAILSAMSLSLVLSSACGSPVIEDDQASVLSQSSTLTAARAGAMPDVPFWSSQGITHYRVRPLARGVQVSLLGSDQQVKLQRTSIEAMASAQSDGGSCVSVCALCFLFGAQCEACLDCTDMHPFPPNDDEQEEDDDCDPDTAPDGCECPTEFLGLDCDETTDDVWIY